MDKMEKEARLKQIRNFKVDNIEAIGMILSACADFGCEKGALLSVKKFSEAAEMILDYLKMQDKNVRDYNNGIILGGLMTEEDGQEMLLEDFKKKLNKANVKNKKRDKGIPQNSTLGEDL